MSPLNTVRSMLGTDAGRTTVLGLGHLGLVTLLQLVTPPLLLACWGDAGFALWLSLRGIAGYVGIADAGLQSYVTQRLALHVGEKDEASYRALADGARRAFAVTGSIGLVVTIGAFFLLGDAIWRELAGTAGLTPGTALAAFSAAVLSGVCGLTMSGWSSAIEASRGAQAVTEAYSLVRSLLLHGVPLILAATDSGLAPALMAGAAAGIVFDVGRYARAWRLVPAPDHRSKAPLSILQVMSRSSYGLLLTAASATQNGMQPSIASTVDPAATATVIPARTLSNAARHLGSALGNATWIPMARTFGAASTLEDKVRAWVPTSRRVYALQLLGVWIVGVLTPFLIPLWLPDKADGLREVVPVLLAEQAIAAAAAPSFFMLSATGRFGQLGSVQLAGATLGAVLTVPLIGLWGTFGFSIASAAGALVIVSPGLAIAEHLAWRRLGRHTAPDLARRWSLSLAAALLCLLAVQSTASYWVCHGILAVLIAVSVRSAGNPDAARRTD